MEFLGYTFAFCFGALCLFLSHALYKLGMKREYTRKIVHIAIGFEWLILYAFFGAGWHSFAVCAAFTALLIVSYFKKLLPMIESDGDNSLGTLYYGISMSALSLVCVFLPNMMLPFGIAVVCTSLGDGLAGVVGQAMSRYDLKIFRNKTLPGTLTNFAVSFIGSLLVSVIFELKITPLDCLAIAAFSSVLELITPYGLDNISVPIGTGALAYLLAYVPKFDGYSVPVIVTPLIVAVAYEKRILTPYGIAVALVLDIAASVAFGNAGFLILLSFLLISVIADKIKKQKSSAAADNARNEIQVLANGGSALVCAAAYVFSHEPVFAAAFAAAMAESLADTVSSGVGALAKCTFDLFRFKKCESGVSGGVSGIGTAAALVASFLIPSFAFSLGLIKPIYILICGALAFVGCFVDSLIGSLLQEKYICKRCKRVTEDKIHCNMPTVKASGLSFVDNNVTNFVSNALVAILVILVG